MPQSRNCRFRLIKISTLNQADFLSKNLRHLNKVHRFWRWAARFILLTAIFALVYTQAPLYTSNQNLYFLPGLAQAGYGDLSADWLATRTNSMPLFTALVNWTYRFTHLEALFYVYYALLMGVYLYSALGIVWFQVLGASEVPFSWKWDYLALFLLVHSAAWRFLLGRTLGDNWLYILEDGVADQRLLGTVFQPSAFGVFLVLSIYLFLKERTYWAVLFAALAASFHPTYLLGAAALTAAYVLLRLKERWPRIKTGDASPRLRLVWETCLPGLLALLAVLPILAYTYLNFARFPVEIAAQARDILVDYRIPHHALVSWWFDATAVVKIAIVIFSLFIVRRSRLFWILGIPFIVAVVLTVVQVLSGNTALALLFPWRISVFLLPLSTVLILAYALQGIAKRSAAFSKSAQAYFTIISGGLILILVLIGIVRLKLDFQRQAQHDDRPLYAYINAHRAPGQQYLVPVKMQDFRLASGAPAYVDFKSHPYQDADMLEWYRRVQLATRFYKQDECEQMPEWIKDEGITHIVLPAGQAACPGLERVYKDKAYSLYTIP